MWLTRAHHRCRSASALKKAGWAFSTPQLDALIHRLESQALNLRLAMPAPAPPGHAALPAGLTDPFAFAYLSEVSPSAGASGATTPVPLAQVSATAASSSDGVVAAGGTGAFDTAGTTLRLEDLLRTPTSNDGALPPSVAVTGTESAAGAAADSGAFAGGNEDEAMRVGIGLDFGMAGLGDEMFAGWGVW